MTASAHQTIARLSDVQLKRAMIRIPIPIPNEEGVSVVSDYGISEYRRRFGEPAPALVTRFGVEALTIAVRTAAGVALVCPCR